MGEWSNSDSYANRWSRGEKVGSEKRQEGKGESGERRGKTEQRVAESNYDTSHLARRQFTWDQQGLEGEDQVKKKRSYKEGNKRVKKMKGVMKA